MKHVKIPAIIIDLVVRKDKRNNDKYIHCTPKHTASGDARDIALKDISESVKKGDYTKNFISHQWEIMTLNKVFRNFIIRINGKSY